MTFRNIIVILMARWKSAAIFMLAVLSICAAYLVFAPRQYTASSTVLLDVKTPDPLLGALSGMLTPGYMASQVDLLKSERVALNAISDLNLASDETSRALWNKETGGVGEFNSWLAERIQKNLDVLPARESSAITVTYTAADSRTAARMANAFVSAFIKTSLELRVEPAKEFNSFFDERLRQLRQNVEASQAKLSAFQKENGLLASGDRLDIENAKLTELSTQLVGLQAQSADSGSRQAVTGNNVEGSQEALNNTLIQSLTTEMSREQSKLKELSERLGSEHPLVKQSQASIAQMQSQISTQLGKLRSSLKVTNGVDQERMARTKVALADQKSRVLALRNVRDKADVFEQDVKNSMRMYDDLASKAGQSSLESKTTRTNISIIKTATPPTALSFPKTGMIIGIAVAIALFGAVVLALVKESLDRRVRVDTDITQLLGAPLLLSLSSIVTGPQAETTMRVRMLRSRVLTGLPSPTK